MINAHCDSGGRSQGYDYTGNMRYSYYNDTDPFCCEWIRTLIAAGEIPPGDVDNRSIAEVMPDELQGYTQCHFFCGIGGWPLALRLAGWDATEPVWTGSCPCQPYSSAGKRKGDSDARNLWPAFFRLIRECRPPVCIGEQVSSAIRHGWLDGISGDLETEGYAVGAAVLGAHSVGAPHIRQRLFWVADAQRPEPGLRDGQERQAEVGWDRPAIDGATDGMADAECDGGRCNEPEREAEGRTADGRACAGFECEACPCRRDGFGDNRARSRGHSHHASHSKLDGLEHPTGNGRQGEPGDDGEEQSAAERAGGDAWSDFAVVHCRDGKTRRVPQSGIFPLAYGIPRKLGPQLARLRAVATIARRNRVGRLRGYGNAIVPQVAAEFIRAFMEQTGTTQQNYTGNAGWDVKPVDI